MKIVVLNYSGNVGKTTIAKHLLIPRMGDCPWIPVESINSGGDKALNFKGKEFNEVMLTISQMSDVVVDIGSSNVESALEQLATLGDGTSDFDFYVIPTVAVVKQQEDTLKLVGDLLAMMVDADRIKVVFNQVPMGINFDRVFGRLVTGLKRVGVVASEEATIHSSDLFVRMNEGQTITEVISVGRDIKAELATEPEKDRKAALAAQLLASRLAKGVKTEMDAVFRFLFPATV